MFSTAFAYLIFACGFSLAATDPCLAPICVVHKPCDVVLPACVRLLPTADRWQWISVHANRVHGVPRKKEHYNLKRFLEEGSCQITITVVAEEEAEQFGNCDYKRSNDSFRNFNEIGRIHPIESLEALHQIMNDPSSSEVPTPRETFTTSTLTSLDEIVKIDNAVKETNAPEAEVSSAASGTSTTTSQNTLDEDVEASNPIPIVEVKIIADDDPEEPNGGGQNPIVEEIRVGDLFSIRLGESNDTFELQETSPNTRVVVVEGRFALGFTIFNENQDIYEFNVSSPSGESFSFKLQPLSEPETPLAQKPANHRFVTESKTSTMDLKEALRQIQEVADNDSVKILSANDTQIVWLSQKYLGEPLCETPRDEGRARTSIDDGDMVTRLETLCPEREEKNKGEKKSVQNKFKRILEIFLMPVFPLVLACWFVIFTLRSKMFPKKQTSNASSFLEYSR